MPNLTITSPGVEIREVDISLAPQLPTGTTVLAAGFSSKGPTNELISITSLSEFEQVFGKPTNPAERYFYHTVEPLFSSPANVTVARLPYGEETGAGRGNNYGVLVYPVNAYETALTGTSAAQTPLSSFDASETATYLVGKPIHVELTKAQYDEFITGTALRWTPSGAAVSNSLSAFADVFEKAGIVVINDSQTTVNDQYEGFYLGISDNTNLNPSTNHTDITDIVSIHSGLSATDSFISLPSARLDFVLTGSNLRSDQSVSEVMENIAGYDISTRIDDDRLNFGLFKIRQSTFSSDTIKLDYVLSEKYSASLDSTKQKNNINGGAPISDFIEAVAQDSVNLNIEVNPYISNKNNQVSWLDINGVPKKKVRALTTNLAATPTETVDSFILRAGVTPATVAAAIADIGKVDALFPIGTYGGADLSNKVIGSVPEKLEYILEQAENREYYNVDIVLEAGLGTIHASVNAFKTVYASLTAGNPLHGFTVGDITSVEEALSFNDTATLPGLSALKVAGDYIADDIDLRGAYNTVASKLTDFCENRRRDCIVVLDGIRQVYIQGADTKNYISGKRGTFASDVYWPLRHTFELLNSSYAALYANWAKVYDGNSDTNVWVPFSGHIGKTLANNDANFQIWSSPMAFTRGRISGVSDIAINPKQKERDQIFKININPIYFSPGDGFVIMGDATALNKPSAFNQIGVRRMFLYVEKASDAILKYFISEPNSTITRNNVVNALTPILTRVQQTDGISQFRVLCDERNNTPAVIDRGQMNVDVYIAPVRSTRFILATFAATNSGVNFDEIIG